MPRSAHPRQSEEIRLALIQILADYDRLLAGTDLRSKVRGLIPVNGLLGRLGGSLLPGGPYRSAKARILAYLRHQQSQIIDGEELRVVAGISEYARRIRELRVQEGWPIVSGVTRSELRESMREEGSPEEELPTAMRANQYLLESDEPDQAAADRWRIANQIRRSRASVKDKILGYLRANVGQPVHSEELRYVAGNKTEWARRTRELRTEEGWPVVTRYTGDPTLQVGVYVLAEDSQAPAHDRNIPELVRREVMKRDSWSCRWVGCRWPTGFDTIQDHRFLEVHHIEHHAKGGSSEDPVNLVTLCNLHHDETHRSGRLELS
jgi:hypothetical protein